MGTKTNLSNKSGFGLIEVMIIGGIVMLLAIAFQATVTYTLRNKKVESTKVQALNVELAIRALFESRDALNNTAKATTQSPGNQLLRNCVDAAGCALKASSDLIIMSPMSDTVRAAALYMDDNGVICTRTNPTPPPAALALCNWRTNISFIANNDVSANNCATANACIPGNVVGAFLAPTVTLKATITHDPVNAALKLNNIKPIEISVEKSAFYFGSTQTLDCGTNAVLAGYDIRYDQPLCACQSVCETNGQPDMCVPDPAFNIKATGEIKCVGLQSLTPAQQQGYIAGCSSQAIGGNGLIYSTIGCSGTNMIIGLVNSIVTLGGLIPDNILTRAVAQVVGSALAAGISVVLGAVNAIGNAIGRIFKLSDENLKFNIQKIEDPITKIQKLKGVTWQWHRDSEKNQTPMGVIAQDVQKIFPQAVSQSAEGYLMVDYAALIGPLIEAVKAQQVQIDNLKKILNEKNINEKNKSNVKK